MIHRITKGMMNWIGVLFVAAVAVLWLAAPKAQAVPTAAPWERTRTIVIDAGHGGSDVGAVGSTSGVKEAGLNLAVAKLVESKLTERGFHVIMTRENEKMLAADKQSDMKARAKVIAADGVDGVVSIHMNKFSDPAIHGPMVFYETGSERGEAFAVCVCDAVCDAIGHPRRIANPGDYFVLRQGKAPAVLVECGFLSNAKDEEKLCDPNHQERLADGIVAGIAAYFR